MAETIISQVHPDDVAYELHLAKQFTDQIGFLPREAIEHYAAIGGVMRARENGDPAGFIVFTKSRQKPARIAQIFQAAIQLDAQRRHHGLALVNNACHHAAIAGAIIMQCWCAADLEANDFWAAVGFHASDRRQGGRRRGRDLILWRKALRDGLAPIDTKTKHQDRSGRERLPLFDI